MNDLIGVGLRQPHYAYIQENKPSIGWFEVHSENFFQKGGPSPAVLTSIRQSYPLSFHGVGLSLGSADGLDQNHLEKLKQLIDRFSPVLVSEHLSWSRIAGAYVPDLLPLPYTDESLEILTHHIDETQTYLKRQILFENPSSYLEYKDSTYTETDFIKELCKRTGAQLLLDINNVFVSSSNHGWDEGKYIDEIPSEIVGEIHLAGHSIKKYEDGTELRLDDHGSTVCKEVWNLFEQAINKGIRVPTLIEWDTDVPEFSVLEEEVKRARSFL